MELSEIPPAPGDPTERALHYGRDGYLLVRNAVDPAQLAAIRTQVSAALHAGGLAMATELRWSGAPVGDLEATGINDVPALDELVARIDAGTDAVRPAAEDICAKPMVARRSPHVFAAIPDDPAHVTVPHQDNFAVRRDGDYRRLWMRRDHHGHMFAVGPTSDPPLARKRERCRGGATRRNTGGRPPDSHCS
ncbi:hypothetical protein [Sciscionella sediminilitoris]|uniref:hypothetical protein n=1 Tax=Sciscionella sediminilitoris TaxID=1445613 RepID=UPI0012E27F63|nr:hypothetical protein [Sciscionella sp. SE31]